MTSDDAEHKRRLPILGTIGLASSLVGHAPGRLIFLVAAEAALIALGERLVDRPALPMSWSAKGTHFAVDQVVFAIMTGAIVAIASATAERRCCRIAAALLAGAARFPQMLVVCVALDLVSVLDFPFSHLASWVVEIFFAVSTPVCMIERLGPIASLSRSLALTRGNRGQIFGLSLVGLGAGLAALAVGAALYFGLKDISDPPWLRAVPIVMALILGVPAVLLAVAIAVIGALVPTALYLNLRSIEAGLAPRHSLDEIASS